MLQNFFKAVLAVFVCFFVAVVVAAAAQFYGVAGGSTVEVNEHSICKKVSNTAGSPTVFIPTNTATEWQAFRDYHPAHIGLADCCAAETCSSLGKECGDDWDDGCGGTLDCGSCVSPKSCNASGNCCLVNASYMLGHLTTCSNTVPPLGGKRIFVTSKTYSNSEITSETVADAKCAALASAAKISGTYKALVWVGNRNPVDLIKDFAYMSCEAVPEAHWHVVARNKNEFWTPNKCAPKIGGGWLAVLNRPVDYDEKGVKVSPLAAMWTGFSYEKKLLSTATVSYICPGTIVSSHRINNCLVYEFSTGAKQTVIWEGFGDANTDRYALSNEIINCNQASVNAECNSTVKRHLYCVEQ
jgi:hypothetical protein